MAELIRVHPDNPSERSLRKVLEVLLKGGVIVYPTDTVYSFGCDLFQPKAIERIARIKGIKPEKADFSIVFDDLSHLSRYTRHVDTPTYKILKRCLPGAYTFILEAGSEVPKLFGANRKTIGIRIPDHMVPRTLVRLLEHPMIASSVHDEDEILEYTTDPELIAEKFDKLVDLVLDSGPGDLFASTVVDLSSGSPEIIRIGKGDPEQV